MRRLPLPLLLAAAACVSTPRPVFGPGVKIGQPSTFVNTCVGARGTRLFFSDPRGRTHAWNVRDGASLWTISGKGRLIHCDDELVLTASVRSRGLNIRGLSARDGKERWSRTRAVPSWVSDGNLHVDAWTDRRGYGVAWKALTYWQGGYPPSEEEEREAHREAGGAFVFSPAAGGQTREVSGGPSYKNDRKIRGYATWDGLHAYTRAADRVEVVHLSSRKRRSLPTTVAPGSSRLYVTRHGPALLVSSTSEQDEDHHRYHVLRARGWDERGRPTWSTELYRERVPDPVP